MQALVFTAASVFRHQAHGEIICVFSCTGLIRHSIEDIRWFGQIIDDNQCCLQEITFECLASVYCWNYCLLKFIVIVITGWVGSEPVPYSATHHVMELQYYLLV